MPEPRSSEIDALADPRAARRARIEAARAELSAATERGDGFLEPITLLGPFPSGAPAIFIDQAARFGQPAAIISCVGDDDFGRVNLNRLRRDGVESLSEPTNASLGVAGAVALVAQYLSCIGAVHSAIAPANSVAP